MAATITKPQRERKTPLLQNHVSFITLNVRKAAQQEELRQTEDSRERRGGWQLNHIFILREDLGKVVSVSFFGTRFCYVARANLKLIICLPVSGMLTYKLHHHTTLERR